MSNEFQDTVDIIFDWNVFPLLHVKIILEISFWL